LSISFEMLTITLFWANYSSLPYGTNRYPYMLNGGYLLVGIGIWQSRDPKSRLGE
jgi:hypothetical protein